MSGVGGRCVKRERESRKGVGLRGLVEFLRFHRAHF